MKFHLNSNIVEGTPEELVKYQELLEELEEEREAEVLKSGHMHVGYQEADSYTDSTEISADEAETASTELQVGDRVKVLKSEFGTEGEATVTAVLEDGDVELAGTNREGEYLTNWSNHVSNLEKIEEAEDSPMGYTFWYIDGVVLNHFNVLKVSLEGYFEDSTGKRYTQQAVSGLIKPIDREDARKKFEKAKNYECLLKYYPTADMFAWK